MNTEKQALTKSILELENIINRLEVYAHDKKMAMTIQNLKKVQNDTINYRNNMQD